MPKKKAKAQSEWKVKVLKELVINGVTWRAQKLKSPDGKIMYGIRSFFKRKDGSEVPMKSGLTIQAAECTPESLSKINKLLKALHTEVSPE